MLHSWHLFSRIGFTDPCFSLTFYLYLASILGKVTMCKGAMYITLIFPLIYDGNRLPHRIFPDAPFNQAGYTPPRGLSPALDLVCLNRNVC